MHKQQGGIWESGFPIWLAFQLIQVAGHLSPDTCDQGLKNMLTKNNKVSGLHQHPNHLARRSHMTDAKRAESLDIMDRGSILHPNTPLSVHQQHAGAV